jgi:hypothetical protein
MHDSGEFAGTRDFNVYRRLCRIVGTLRLEILSNNIGGQNVAKDVQGFQELNDHGAKAHVAIRERYGPIEASEDTLISDFAIPVIPRPLLHRPPTSIITTSHQRTESHQ